ncbi:hypothetical protein ACH5RR_000393 [Cinchona calisaya]|uniref:GATA transcription factor n=1 Tax=Cinchona calisaya TaxID=153742 RepID=A0ABD3B1K7_9GENT
MDMDVFGIDDLLDFSNEDQLFTSSTSTTTTDSDHHHHHHHHFSYPSNSTPAATATNYFHDTPPNNQFSSSNFTDDLCVPNDDIAELEWLSNFVDDSFSELPTYSVTGTMNVRPETTSFNSRSRTKRSRSTTAWTGENIGTSSNKNDVSSNINYSEREVITRRERSSPEMFPPRKCTHCSSEKTPQWRTGPLGPKTLCNACGVRYKSGRLVPEYRPAASPTFVLTQHSNSHRKVVELRRQKELFRQQQEQQDIYGNNQHRRYQVC